MQTTYPCCHGPPKLRMRTCWPMTTTSGWLFDSILLVLGPGAVRLITYYRYQITDAPDREPSTKLSQLHTFQRGWNNLFFDDFLNGLFGAAFLALYSVLLPRGLLSPLGWWTGQPKDDALRLMQFRAPGAQNLPLFDAFWQNLCFASFFELQPLKRLGSFSAGCNPGFVSRTNPMHMRTPKLESPECGCGYAILRLPTLPPKAKSAAERATNRWYGPHGWGGMLCPPIPAPTYSMEATT